MGRLTACSRALCKKLSPNSFETVSLYTRIHPFRTSSSNSRNLRRRLKPAAKSISNLNSVSQSSMAMGKAKDKGKYNDFLDGEKLSDNTSVRTSLQGPSSTQGDISPPPPTQQHKRSGKRKQGNEHKKPPLTHFLCFPLVNEHTRPQIQKSLELFREEVAAKGIVPPKAVRPVGTLHLTLGVMSVPSEDALQEEIRRLQSLDLGSLLSAYEDQSTANRTPLTVHLRGLAPMQARHKTSILYAMPDDATGRLQKFSEELKALFAAGDHSCLVKDSRPLKLHATIVNTIYAKSGGRGGQGKRRGHKSRDGYPNRAEGVQHNEEEGQHRQERDSESPDENVNAPPDVSAGESHAAAERPASTFDGSSGHGPNAKSWLRFDASEMIDQYKDFVWAGDVAIDRVHICKMGAKKILDEHGEIVDEQYEVVATKLIDSAS